MQTRKQMRKHIYVLMLLYMLIYQDQKYRIHSRKNKPVRKNVRVKNQTPQIFPVDFQLKTPTLKILSPLKRTEPKCGQKNSKEKNQKQRMNEPVRKSLRVEGLENRRPSILICATCVCVHRSTMIFVVFVFVLFCFVFALRIFLQRCKKELLQVNRVKSISSMG